MTKVHFTMKVRGLLGNLFFDNGPQIIMIEDIFVFKYVFILYLSYEFCAEISPKICFAEISHFCHSYLVGISPIYLLFSTKIIECKCVKMTEKISGFYGNDWFFDNDPQIMKSSYGIYKYFVFFTDLQKVF